MTRAPLALAASCLAAALLFAPPAAGAGEQRQRVEELNALGVEQLVAGDTTEAVATLERATDAAAELPAAEGLDDVARSRLLFNLGAALERSGDVAAACSRYREALALDPQYAPAWRAYERAFEKLPDDQKSRRGRALVGTLIDEGNFRTAEAYLRSSLLGATDRGGTPFIAAAELPRELARLLVGQRLDPDTFRRTWLPLLPAPGGGDHTLAGADAATLEKLGRIAWLYVGEMPVLWDPDEARHVAGAWARDREELALFSRLARAVADGHQRAGRPAEALPRYALACSAAGDYGAAAYFAGLLLEDGERLDPEGELLERMIAGLFEEKGTRYASGDWDGMARLHTVLGEIFHARGEWGSESEPASAVFQWRRAIEARERAQGGEGAAPALHAQLAVAYHQSGRLRDAVESYRLAADQYGAAGRWSEATRMREYELAARTALAGQPPG